MICYHLCIKEGAGMLPLWPAPPSPCCARHVGTPISQSRLSGCKAWASLHAWPNCTAQTVAQAVLTSEILYPAPLCSGLRSWWSFGSAPFVRTQLDLRPAQHGVASVF